MGLDPRKTEFVVFCKAVLSGGEPVSNLEISIAATRRNLDDLKENFGKQVFLENPEIQEKCKAEAEEVLASLDGYYSAVNVVEQYLQDRERGTLVRGMELARRALEQMNTSIYRYRVAVLVAQGPTDMPHYNLFVRCVNDYKERKLGEKDIRDLIRVARSSSGKFSQSIQKFKNIPEVERLIDALKRHSEALEAMEKSLLDKKSLDQAFQVFRETCESVRDLQGPARFKIFSQGPTQSEAANRMLNICKQLLDRKAHPFYFNENLKSIEAEYSFFKGQFDSLQSALDNAESDLLKEAFQESRAGMALYEKAIQLFRQFTERYDTAFVVQGMKVLEEAVGKLSSVYKAVSELAEREGKNLCVRCQHYNAQDRKTCEKCGAVLPRMVEKSEDWLDKELREALLGMPVTENIKNILAAGENVAQGILSKAEFDREVRNMEELVERNWQAIESTQRSRSKQRKPDEAPSQIEEEAFGLFKKGVQELKKGLSLYRQFLEKEEVDFIKNGSRQILLGAHKIYQVVRFNPSGK